MPNPKQFRANDTKMPFLAVQVSIGLDNNYRLGRRDYEEEILRLSEILYNTSISDSIDPSTMCVLGEAIGLENLASRSGGEIYLQLNLASKELRNYKEISKERFENLRDFCIQLSRRTAGFQSNNYGHRRNLAA